MTDSIGFWIIYISSVMQFMDLERVCGRLPLDQGHEIVGRVTRMSILQMKGVSSTMFTLGGECWKLVFTYLIM